VVFHLPRVVEAEPVGELDLIERVPRELVLVVVTPWLRKLVFIENSELHTCSSAQSAPATAVEAFASRFK
jgi:hypothetical protein